MPPFWTLATRELSDADPVLAEIIQQHSMTSLVRRSDAFVTLARAIVGQQISVKAAATIWSRFSAHAEPVSPKSVLGLQPDDLRNCGLSARKTEYIFDLARHFHEGIIVPSEWSEVPDEEVIQRLIAVRGIGRWTAEMFLIFNMLRSDVLPLADVGLQRAVAIHYFRGRAVKSRTIRRLAKRWTPWCSVATWYLWRSLEPDPVVY